LVCRKHDILLTVKNDRQQQPPSVKLYSIVLEGWCRRVGKVPHAMDRAEELLQEMEELSEGGSSSSSSSSSSSRSRSRTGTRPNVLTYTSAIGGFLARSKERDLATRADQMLEGMNQGLGTKPSSRFGPTSRANPQAPRRRISHQQGQHSTRHNNLLVGNQLLRLLLRKQ
jgi:hypothetical protein